MSKLLLVGPHSVHLWRFYEMVKQGIDQIEVITDQEPEKLSSPNLKVTVVSFSLRHPLEFYRTIRRIRQQIRESRPDIIHCHMANTTALAVNWANRGMKVPVVLTAWGSDVLVAPFQSSFLRRMVTYNLREAQILTSDSRYMAEKMRELLPEKKLDIHIANFGIGVVPDPLVRKENLIYSNRLHEPLYRIDAIIHAFQDFVKEDHESWQLVIAGTGSQTESLKKLVKTLGLEPQVEFVGWLNPSDNAAYYNRSKLYVSIPESDATSISLLEAMACGCIPVVSELPANTEWVVDGKNGVLVKDVRQAFLKNSLMLDAGSVQNLNREIIEQKATVEANREVFLSIYRHLLQA